ncbi:MAG: hypothetical protein OXD45_01940, partial [Rhodobacteraceae bacterium]|nr:hypothetical protein [Paracoccaceae bacterium]
MEEDLVIDTEDSKDFMALLNGEEIHPGLIILPNIPILKSKALIKLAIEYLWRLALGNPMDLLVSACPENTRFLTKRQPSRQ